MHKMQTERTHSKELPKSPEELIDGPYSVLDQRNLILSTVRSKQLVRATQTPTFQRQHRGILIVKGVISNGPDKILIDPGGEVNFLSKSFFDLHKIKTEESAELAEMANGVDQKLMETQHPVIVQIKKYTEPLYFARSPLKRYDAILGKEWCGSHKAIIDTAENHVSFNYKDENYFIAANERLLNSFVSANSILTDLEKNYGTYAVFLRPLSSKPYSKEAYYGDIQDILIKYEDVFPNRLPKGLPPKRKYDSKIELKKKQKPRRRVSTVFWTKKWGNFSSS